MRLKPKSARHIFGPLDNVSNSVKDLTIYKNLRGCVGCIMAHRLIAMSSRFKQQVSMYLVLTSDNWPLHTDSDIVYTDLNEPAIRFDRPKLLHKT